MDLVESGQVALDATLDTYLAGFDPVTALGETLVFERDGRGTVVSMLTEGYRYFRQ